MVKAMMTDHELVRTCLEEIYRQNGYEDIDRLTYRDHEHISQRIEMQTSTLISVSTIKRLLNGEFSRIPQAATLQALASYLGYAGWQEYRVAVKMQSTIHPPSLETSFGGRSGPQSTENKDAQFTENAGPRSDADGVLRVEVSTAKAVTHKPVWLRYTTLASGALVALVIAVLFIRYSAGHAIRHADKATFSAQKITSNDIPNTVVFHYNVDDVQADSFFIQQSWDVNRRVRVYKNSYTLTDTYYEPGYHIAKLMANDSIIRTIDVSIPTDRWFLLAKDPTPATTIPQYLKPTLPLLNAGIFKLDPADLLANQVDVKTLKTFVYAYYPSLFSVNSDDYTFKTRLRIREVRNNACPNLMLEILAQRYYTYIHSAPKGCSGELFAQFGEKFFHGRQHDLSPLAFDVSHWTDIEINVKDKAVTVSFNGKLVFSTTYEVALGYLTGLAFVSNGLPEIDYVDLRGADGVVFYHNDFNDAL